MADPNSIAVISLGSQRVSGALFGKTSGGDLILKRYDIIELDGDPSLDVSRLPQLKLALPPAMDVEMVQSALTEAMPRERISVRSFEEAQPTLRLFLARMGDFLRLATLVTLVLGGLGVAQSIRVFLQQKQDSIAILKVLGATTREVTLVYLLQCLGLALLGSVLGLGLGLGRVRLEGRRGPPQLPQRRRQWLPLRPAPALRRPAICQP